MVHIHTRLPLVISIRTVLPDIVVANYGTDSVGIFLREEHGSFEEMKIFSTGNDSAPSSVAVADLNNDTYLDIAISNSQTDNIAILLGYGNGTFATAVTYSTGARFRSAYSRYR